MFGDVASSIECGDWWIPSDTHEYVDIRDNMIDMLIDFYSLTNDELVEIKSFDSDILSFDKGIYPDYH